MTSARSALLGLTAFCSIAALVWLLAARILGPSDLWDQTQPRTVSYTTDIVANGRWWLPVSHGEFPATKPPLYNWIAVPAVRALGYASELAHKLPSVLALLASWLLLVRFGRRLGAASPRVAGGGEALGWMTGLAFVSNYSIFKLGYLARPDMLLTLWMLIGWLAATALFVGARTGAPTRARVAAAFWVSVGLAALTKGPAAVVLVLYALVAARFVGGSWRTLRATGWWWGIPLAGVLAAAWYFAVWRIDPVHLRDELWFNEVWGRVTGTGPEGTGGGPASIVRGLPVMPLYYLTRFLPWSLFSLLALGAIVKRARHAATADPDRELTALEHTMLGAVLFLLITIALFTLSAGKRADYAAPAFAPGALLAAWWLLTARPFARLPWLGPVCAASTLALLTVRNALAPEAPARNFGDAITAFAGEAGAAIRDEPRPVFFHNTGRTHMQAMLGFSAMPGSAEDLLVLIDRREPIWIVAGGYPDGPNAFSTWAPLWYPSYDFTPVVGSAVLPGGREGWPIQVTLYRADAATNEP